MRRWALPVGIGVLVSGACAGAPGAGLRGPEATLAVGFAQAWQAAVDELGTADIAQRCVIAPRGSSPAEPRCEDATEDRLRRIAQGSREGAGLIVSSWLPTAAGNVDCGGGDLSAVFSGHEARFEVIAVATSETTTLLRVDATYRARPVGSSEGTWSACASNGEPERRLRAAITARAMDG